MLITSGACKPEASPPPKPAEVKPATDSPKTTAPAEPASEEPAEPRAVPESKAAEPPKTLEPSATPGRADFSVPEDATFGLVAMAVGTGVADRKPVGTGDTFGLSAGTLTGWAEVRNKDAETEVTMVWRRDGEEKARTAVKVGVSPGWRTWTRKRLGKRGAGAWELEIFSADDASLGKVAFQVTDDLPADCASAGGECQEGCEEGRSEYEGTLKKKCFDSVCCVKKQAASQRR